VVVGGEKRRRRTVARPLYWSEFTDDERCALAEAGIEPAPDGGGILEDEAAVLRILIRRALAVADPAAPPNAHVETIGRLVDRLGRLLRTRRALAPREDGPAIGELLFRAGAQALAAGRARAARPRRAARRSPPPDAGEADGATPAGSGPVETTDGVTQVADGAVDGPASGASAASSLLR
jgi:hypothetical protein